MASARTLGAAAAVLAVAGAGLLAYGVAAQEPAPPTPPPGVIAAPETSPQTSSPPPAASPSPRRTEGPAPLRGPVLSPSAPVEVRLPALGVTGRTVELGLQEDGTMEVPQNGTAIGWYAQSPTPGTRGPSVLAAHVTWNRKPAVFFRLGALRPGDPVEVDRADGTTAVFEVTKVGRYAKADFPTVEVYANLDHAGLRLITCGGEFDESSGHHLDNVVVYAKLVGSRPA